jgi:hypothetical protein
MRTTHQQELDIIPIRFVGTENEPVYVHSGYAEDKDRMMPDSGRVHLELASVIVKTRQERHGHVGPGPA